MLLIMVSVPIFSHMPSDSSFPVAGGRAVTVGQPDDTPEQ